jgi:hypothetical protein
MKTARLLEKLDDVAEAFKDQSERRKLWLLCGFSILYLVITSSLASRKPMWYDELFTLYISRLAGFSDIWSALLTGADQTPPFFHLITRASFSLFGVNHLSIRLPEVLGFWVMSLCLFRFVSKRSSALYGFAAMLFPLATKAYYYAYEARPYGIVLGLSALSLLCWQSAAEGHYRKLSLIGLAISLVAAVSSHYYAVLLFFPLAVGEVVRSLSRRRLDLPIWVAFGFAMTPLLLFLPLIERGWTYAAGFWAEPLWRSIPKFYYFLLTPALLPLVAILIFSAIYPTTHPVSRRNQESRLTPPFHEIAAAFGFVAIPVVAVTLAIFVTGAFTDRYALPSVMGFSILIAFATYKLPDGRAFLGAALVLFLCGGFVMNVAQNFQKTTNAFRKHLKIYSFLRSESESRLPIVVSHPLTFMQLTYYAPPDIASRFVYLADPEASLLHMGNNTSERNLLELKPWFQLKVEGYTPYVASQRRFLVYSNARLMNWLLSELKAADMRIELRSRNKDNLLFLVSPKDSPEDPKFAAQHR